MGEVDCLKACPTCSRHVKCHERSCPFCGTGLTFFMRVLDYRVKTRLDRGATFALGAALGAVGFAIGCDGSNTMALYGGVCAPPSCMVGSTNPGAGSGGGGDSGGLNLNTSTQGGASGSSSEGGAAGTPNEGGAAGEQ